MEQSAEFDLDLAVQQFLNSYNPSGILSKTDRDELFDHLHTEINVLEDSGLTAEEAFMISQKRMGEATVISAEYQKAKPWARFIQLFAFASILLLGLKLIFNLVRIVSLSSTVLISEFSTTELAAYLQWGDIPLQLFSLIAAFGVGAFILKRMDSARLKDLWPVPMIYLLSEVARFGMVLIATQNIGPAVFGTLSLNSTYLLIGCMLMGAISVLGLFVKHKDLKIQFA
ncbi:MAG: hypothetical protein AB8H47_03320 [Bacteroidia bacterium]